MNERTLIYLDDAINLVEDLETKRLQGDVGLLYAPMIKGLKALPSAPQRTGRWVKIKESIKLSEYRCSECGRTVWDDRGYNPHVDYPYCHCGARM